MIDKKINDRIGKLDTGFLSLKTIFNCVRIGRPCSEAGVLVYGSPPARWRTQSITRFAIGTGGSL